MTVGQILTHWIGGPSSPGVTVMNVRWGPSAIPNDAVAAVRGFWADRSLAIPDDITLRVDPQIELFNESTGQLTGVETATVVPSDVTGQSPSDWAAGIGVRIDWRTSVIRNGRRVSGRTFIVPTNVDLFTSSGVVDSGTQTAFNEAASTMLQLLSNADTVLTVWSRPSTKYPVGALADVASGALAPKAAILRGRRD